MAPTIVTRSTSGEQVRHIARALSSTISKLSIRDAASSSAPLASVFALVFTSRSSLSRRALTSIAELSARDSSSSSILTDDLSLFRSSLYKRQNPTTNFILAIPATYKGLNDGPSPGAVVGITLGSVFGFILCLYILLLSLQTWGGGIGGSTTVVKEEVVIDKRRSHSRKSRKSSHHTSVHDASPPAPPRSRRETVIEIEEEIIRHSSHHSPVPPASEHTIEEVIVQEEESTVTHTASDEIVVVVEEEEEQSSLASPPPRKASSRRSGFRIVDPAEPGGGRASMTRMSRRSSARSPGS